jgi:hypothetical protein
MAANKTILENYPSKMMGTSKVVCKTRNVIDKSEK